MQKVRAREERREQDYPFQQQFAVLLWQTKQKAAVLGGSSTIAKLDQNWGCSSTDLSTEAIMQGS